MGGEEKISLVKKTDDNSWSGTLQLKKKACQRTSVKEVG